MTVKNGAVVRPRVGGGCASWSRGVMTVESGARLDVTGLGYRGRLRPLRRGAGPARRRGRRVAARRWREPRRPGCEVDQPGPAGEVFDSVFEPRSAAAAARSILGGADAAGAAATAAELDLRS